MDWASQLLDIFKAALEAVHPERGLAARLKREGDFLQVGDERVSLGRRRLHIISVGKAAEGMARAALRVLGEVAGGLVISNKIKEEVEGLRCLEASHPYPDERSLEAGREALSYASSLSEQDLLIFLISGGASSLMVLPRRGITLEDKIKTVQLLIKSPADIKEINTVRKHISAIKGGQLAHAAHPAGVVTLALSDIVRDPLEFIGSGPTVPDPTTFQQAVEVLRKYDLYEKVPLPVRELLERGCRGLEPETPEEGFEGDSWFVVLNNWAALKAAAKKAAEKGMETVILTGFEEGRIEEWVDFYSRIVEHALSREKPSRPRLYLSGGEITVEVKGKGRGGRNQEFVLRMAEKLASFEKGWMVASLGTDGIDGPTDAAGAVAGPETVRKAQRLGLSMRRYIENNDSYTFFEKLGGLVKTGPTGTNVMDIRMMLVLPE